MSFELLETLVINLRWLSVMSFTFCCVASVVSPKMCVTKYAILCHRYVYLLCHRMSVITIQNSNLHLIHFYQHLFNDINEQNKVKQKLVP